jgi:hypothetical protein
MCWRSNNPPAESTVNEDGKTPRRDLVVILQSPSSGSRVLLCVRRPVIADLKLLWQDWSRTRGENWHSFRHCEFDVRISVSESSAPSQVRKSCKVEVGVIFWLSEEANPILPSFRRVLQSNVGVLVTNKQAGRGCYLTLLPRGLIITRKQWALTALPLNINRRVDFSS